jgi:hypothetical protein
VFEANSLRLVPLDWNLYRGVLREQRFPIHHSPPSSNEDASTNGGSNPCNIATKEINSMTNHVPWKDPTLFSGLEEFMTVSEHEFLSKMMTSGQCEMISSAATILQGIMEMSSFRRAPAILPQSSRSFDSHDGQQQQRNYIESSSSRPVKLSSKMVEHMHRVRKRFPLPINMPRCVSIPLYDPLLTKPKPLLEFAVNSATKETTLKLKGINGYAGRVGLRKGDMVTHVDGNLVETFDDFVNAMQSQLTIGSTSNITSSEAPSVQIIVNATQDAANALQDRYHDMMKNNIRFHY